MRERNWPIRLRSRYAPFLLGAVELGQVELGQVLLPQEAL
jgi:hypothetical protein